MRTILPRVPRKALARRLVKVVAKAPKGVEVGKVKAEVATAALRGPQVEKEKEVWDPRLEKDLKVVAREDSRKVRPEKERGVVAPKVVKVPTPKEKAVVAPKIAKARRVEKVSYC